MLGCSAGFGGTGRFPVGICKDTTAQIYEKEKRKALNDCGDQFLVPGFLEPIGEFVFCSPSSLCSIADQAIRGIFSDSVVGRIVVTCRRKYLNAFRSDLSSVVKLWAASAVVFQALPGAFSRGFLGTMRRAHRSRVPILQALPGVQLFFGQLFFGYTTRTYESINTCIG